MCIYLYVWYTACECVRLTEYVENVTGADIYHVFVFAVIIKMRNSFLDDDDSLILLRRCESNNAHCELL